MLPSKKPISNLAAVERHAWRNHKRNTEIVLREAVEESAEVVMSCERYTTEA